jgi:hypothetical protein
VTILDYLLMRTPPARLAPQKQAASGTVSTPRIVVSILGILLGIIASFYVSGLQTQAVSKHQEPAPSIAAQAQGSDSSGQSPASEAPQVKGPFTWKAFGTVVLISVVICGLTYQALYLSLRLYQQEPAFLVLFVSFQYGFFWQAAIQGASAVFKVAT